MIHPARQGRLPDGTTPRIHYTDGPEQLAEPEKWIDKPPQSTATLLARRPRRIGHAVPGQGTCVRVGPAAQGRRPAHPGPGAVGDHQPSARKRAKIIAA